MVRPVETSSADRINAAQNIVAKDIFARTETGAPVAAMCDPSTVRMRLSGSLVLLKLNGDSGIG